MWEFFKEKWKAAISILVALVGAVFVALRFRSEVQGHKDVLENANNAHKAELEAIKDSQDELDAGLEEISRNSEDRIKKIVDNSDRDHDVLAKEKQDFIEKSKESDDLAKKIAHAIGADFVEPTKE